MNQTVYPSDLTGGIPMVKIDGAKIRAIRESKGLTQLYLATAVGVTTDTISRWENRRYPTIKKENGLKLAEALETPLEDILDTSDQQTVQDPPDQSEEIEPPTSAKSNKPNRTLRPIFILMGSGLLVLLAIALFFLNGSQPQIAAHRILPNHSAPAQPFPVAIKVTCDSTKPVSLILKEQFPKGATLLASSPASSAFNPATGEVKWLQKITGEQFFVCLIKLEGELNRSVDFSGTLAIRSARKKEITVQGDRAITLSSSHWADSNVDGKISDEEILMVHDLFSEIEGLALDIDLIEEMWLGSGYVWQPEKNSFYIIP